VLLDCVLFAATRCSSGQKIKPKPAGHWGHFSHFHRLKRKQRFKAFSSPRKLYGNRGEIPWPPSRHFSQGTLRQKFKAPFRHGSSQPHIAKAALPSKGTTREVDEKIR